MAFFSFSCLYSQEEARLLRFPAIHGNQLVFSYAGDLYTVDATVAWPADHKQSRL